jgi:hypothetical protein
LQALRCLYGTEKKSGVECTPIIYIDNIRVTKY